MNASRQPRRWSRFRIERGERLLLALTLIGLGLGSGAWIARYRDAAGAIWAVTTVAALAPLALSIVRDLWHRRAGVDVIALLAMAGALLLREYFAGAVIGVMYSSGRALEEYASARATRELRALLERMPQVVHRYEGTELTSPSLDDVSIGDRLLVNTGEIVPVDGFVEGNAAVLDESALTGEAEPVAHEAGEAIQSGSSNAGAAFNLRATATAANSTYAGIVRLAQTAQSSKAPFVRIADRFAVAFLPLTLLLAGIAWAASGQIGRALAVLVVATPCPLILAAPVAIVAGISRAARRGVIIKDGGALEALGRARVLLLDKTGTLTAGRPALAEIVAPEHVPQVVLRLAASLDQASAHVLALAIVRAARDQGLVLAFPTAVVEQLGKGIRGTVDGIEVAIGRLDWITEAQPPAWVRRLRRRAALEGLGNVFVALDGSLAGAFILDDPIRSDSPRTLRELRRAGLERIVMVTGDRAEVAQMVGAAVGVDEVFAERVPAEKVEVVRIESSRGTTIMVGDGINDAPALAAADVGVAMGARGATASSEAADVVLVVDRLDRLAEALQIARRSRAIALQSVIAGMGLSGIAMVVAALGRIPPVAGAILQEAIDVAVILNALRALRDARVSVSVSEPEIELARRFAAEHRDLWPIVDRLRGLADQLDVLEPAVALAEAQRIAVSLTDQLLPHEVAEEASFYPVVARLLGAADATGTMSRAHTEIVHQTRVLCSLLADLTPEGPEAEDLPELRKLLYGLYAILRLHFAQENADYLSLVEIDGGDVENARPEGTAERVPHLKGVGRESDEHGML